MSVSVVKRTSASMWCVNRSGLRTCGQDRTAPHTTCSSDSNRSPHEGEISSRPRSMSEIESAYTWADRVARSWNLDHAGRDRLAIDGIETGPTILVEAFDAILDVSRRNGGESDPPGRTLYRAMKRRGLDRSLRTWALRGTVGGWPLGRSTGSRPRPLVVAQAPVLFLSELATPSTLEPSMIVARSLPSDAYRVATSDPRAHRAWRREGQTPIPLLLAMREERRLLAEASGSAKRVWEAFAASPPSVSFRGRDVTSEILAALRPLVLKSVPWLAVERRAIERVLATVEPRHVVVASDQHRIGRLAATIRKTATWRLIVLQHGLPQDTLGFLPVVADTVATWSEASRDWFIAGGTEPDRLAVTGNPRLDRTVRTDRTAIRASVSERLSLDGRPRLLVALSGSSAETSEALVRIAIESTRLLADSSLVIKLHPGGGDWSRIEEIVNGLGDSKARVRVVDREPIDPLLWWADLVLVHRSSVAVEALAAGTPVVAADLDGRSIADLDLLGLALPRVADGAALATLARELLEPDRRADYFGRRRATLEIGHGTRRRAVCRADLRIADPGRRS